MTVETHERTLTLDGEITPQEAALLRSLSARFPTIGAARAEVAALRAGLQLPKPVVNVLSDVHGEYKKLRHVINNASGSLRPLVESLFADRLSAAEIRNLLTVLYYPHEFMSYHDGESRHPDDQKTWALKTLRCQFEIVRRLAATYRRDHVRSIFPPEFRELFLEFLEEPCTAARAEYLATMVGVLAEYGIALEAVRAASRVVRNLSVGEIMVAGDMGDRGPRIDYVIDYLMRQPGVSIVWGNHDASWMGACLGQEACIATVLRFSVRYGRLEQLEEGFGVSLTPLEQLARDQYGEDPAAEFQPKAHSFRDDMLVARMQKAIAILEFKLVGQTIRRHPGWNLEHRNLLHRIDFAAGTVEVDGKIYPLKDTHFPTIDPNDPYALSAEERTCMDLLRQAFIASPRLWEQMKFLVDRGSMWQRRDDALIFHACVPVDAQGKPLPLQVEGVVRTGRALFDVIASLIRRSFRQGAERVGETADWFWYLWGADRSPLFGKDRLATFESYFIEDKQTHVETKNPYFDLIHDAAFCKTILREFGVSEDGLIVNGHVPVKIEAGEHPVKRGGNAVTIDGAFSEAYGDHGYTLILAPEGITLAEHHHFESVEEAIVEGADIIPKIQVIRAYDPPHSVGDTEEGERQRVTLALLERLILAYQEGILREGEVC